jgi:hypothetical protein
MEPRQDQQKSKGTQNRSRPRDKAKKRFQVVKLEERLAPKFSGNGPGGATGGCTTE